MKPGRLLRLAVRSDVNLYSDAGLVRNGMEISGRAYPDDLLFLLSVVLTVRDDDSESNETRMQERMQEVLVLTSRMQLGWIQTSYVRVIE